MDVEAVPHRHVEDRLRQDQPISRDHGNVRLQRGEGGLLLIAPKRFGGAHRESDPLGVQLDGGGAICLAAPGRAGWLGIDREDFVSGLVQCLKRGHCEVRRSHEDDPHKRAFTTIMRWMLPPSPHASGATWRGTPYVFPWLLP